MKTLINIAVFFSLSLFSPLSFQQETTKINTRAIIQAQNIIINSKSTSEALEKAETLRLSGDFQIAKEIYEYIAQTENNSHAQLQLAFMYLNGEETTSENLALFWFKKSAENGNTEAQYRTGMLLSTPNPEDAIPWLEKASQKNHLEAQYNLGLILKKKNSLNDAIYWLNKAAIQGSIDSRFELGKIYSKTNKRDYEKALYWLTPLAPKNPEAALIIGNIKLQSKDMKDAYFWVKKAAESGLKEAQHDLAFMLYRGVATIKDFASAAYWFEKAAKQGDYASASRLALMYYDGSLPVNLVLAYQWSIVSSYYGGNESAFSYELERRLTREQMESARNSARKLIELPENNQP